MTKPHFTLWRALLSCALTALLVPAAASAAPDRTLTLSSATAELGWDGAQATSSINPVTGEYLPENCTKGEENYCDQTLLKIESGGPVTLDVGIGEYGNPASDFDLFVYKSDAKGSATEDDEITESNQPSVGPFTPPSTGLPNGFAESTTIPDVEPGYVLVIVSYYEVDDDAYKGTAKVTGATPVPGGTTTTPPPSTTPPPTTSPAPTTTAPAFSALPFRAATTLGSVRKAKKTRSLSFSATAGETITGLTVQLLKGKKVFGTARVATFAKGTRKLRLKLSKAVAKKLKAGSYTLGSRGSVNGQALQVLQSVKIKK